MLKSDKYILEHLSVYDTGLSDSYSIYEKVEAWVVKNGGTIQKLSDKKILGERKGFIVRIIFPGYGKRDMKNIMATVS